MIAAVYPGTAFEVTSGEDDPDIIQLIATVDVEDTDDVMDVVIDRLLELEVDEGLPIYLVPIHLPERVLSRLRSESQGQRPHRPL